MDIPVCSLLFADTNAEGTCNSVAPSPCFNSLATCSSLPDYKKKTARAFFVDSTLDLDMPVGQIYNGAFPVANILSVDVTPPRIALGDGLGARGVLRVTFTDHPTSDLQSYEDPYTLQRDYNPFKQGTFWAKFMARHKFLRGQEVRWASVDPRQISFDNFPDNSQLYIIDRFEMGQGSITMIAKDPASIIDDQRAIAPTLNRGVLQSAITAGQGTAVLFPAGIGDAEYPASGFLNIGGNEIVAFTRSGDNLTITRGQFNTEAQEHEAEDRVQVCLVYTAQPVVNIIHDLMVNFGGIPAGYIDLPAWQARNAAFIDRVYTGVIAEPTPVKNLITELLEQASSFIWWDGQEFRFDVLRNIIPTISYDDDLVRAGSISIKEQPEKRVSQVWIYFGQISPLEGLTDPKNYASALVTAEGTVADLEAKFDNIPAVKTIFSRWITRFNRSAAELLNARILQRFATPPKMVTFELLANQPTPTLAQGINLSTFYNQGPTGMIAPMTCQILELNRSAETVRIAAEEVEFTEIDDGDPTIKTLDIDGDVFNFNWYNQFITEFPGDPNDGDTIILRINPGARVGSNNVQQPSIMTGDFPDGDYTLKIIVSSGSLVAGKGGAGAFAQSIITVFGNNIDSLTTASAGQKGGTAIFHGGSKSLIIENEGIIGGGGGGGGSASNALVSSTLQDRFHAVSSGGGSGQGFFDTSGGGATSSSNKSNDLVQSFNGGDGVSNSAGNSTEAKTTESSRFCSAKGGNGGTLGQPGEKGSFDDFPFGFTRNPKTGAGGGAGNSIDGWSHVTYSGTGQLLGPTIN